MKQLYVSFISLLLSIGILTGCSTQSPAPIEYGNLASNEKIGQRGKHNYKDDRSFRDQSSNNHYAAETITSKKKQQHHFEPRLHANLEDKRAKKLSTRPKELEKPAVSRKKQTVDIENTKLKPLEKTTEDEQAEKVIRPNHPKSIVPKARKDDTNELDQELDELYSTKDTSVKHETTIPTVQKVESIEPKDTIHLLKPVKNAKIVVKFGDKVGGQKNSAASNGVNFAAKEGDSVVAAAAGTVVHLGRDSKFGNSVIIKHLTGDLYSAYAHLQSISVQKNQTVKKGDVIGKVGATGEVSEAQLHFALRRGKTAVDPIQYFE